MIRRCKNSDIQRMIIEFIKEFYLLKKKKKKMRRKN